ncbi:hypothetical protein MY04_2560 [Flammeovirga sp. MY04]|uniref:hypothetical protein n=1 Tax=Flammeovirga sp. MY04 TaxID=1191459 RepID=UPI0008060C35|nr:hypothetical protein [Flammeovirga sp. MY04]ANQ49929.1 hypothetical protein MY04_2560 [Flammeovirga sp. MY04]
MRYFTITSLFIISLFFTSCGNEVNQEFEPIQEELKIDASGTMATDLDKDNGNNAENKEN